MKRYDLPVPIDPDRKDDFFTPTEEYLNMCICKRCTRTDGMTKTNSICRYCKHNNNNNRHNNITLWMKGD